MNNNEKLEPQAIPKVHDYNEASWAELYEFSDRLVLETPDSMIEDGLAILSCLYTMCSEIERGDHERDVLPSQISQNSFLRCMTLAQGLIKMGSALNTALDQGGRHYS